MRERVIETLESAWKSGVCNDCERGFISSERELQASLYFHFRSRLSSAAGTRILIEPTLIAAGFIRRPDIIIAHEAGGSNEYRVAAIIELKLDRGKFIRFGIELDRIEEVARQERLTMADQRPGKANLPVQFHLNQSTQFVLGFVGSEEAEAVWPKDVANSKRGKAFAETSPELLSRTTMMFGRLKANDDQGFVVRFDAEPWGGAD